MLRILLTNLKLDIKRYVFFLIIECIRVKISFCVFVYFSNYYIQSGLIFVSPSLELNNKTITPNSVNKIYIQIEKYIHTCNASLIF